MGHFEVGVCRINSWQTHFSAMRKKKVWRDTDRQANDAKLFLPLHRYTLSHQLQLAKARWSGWFADLPDRCSDPTSQSFPSIYPPSVHIHVSQEGHNSGKQGFLCIHLFWHVAQLLVAPQRTHTDKHTDTHTTQKPFITVLFFHDFQFPNVPTIKGNRQSGMWGKRP